ncbi:hypothetical protein Micbo1qcDRAFT_177892 [Microdochium bolleyi]|uniref:Uncharacterized protein n=1 Tax=Microdochium bolleyi TaxID=196109 RepID=A0A136IVR8_9PEZI|nr:hypothetical protein Micbo1qcDRAFT_177892 [Microdochium bolleyi]
MASKLPSTSTGCTHTTAISGIKRIMDFDCSLISKVSPVAEATESMLGSTQAIPPEVRHYLNVLRQNIRDVQILHELRDQRMQYLRDVPHELSEVSGIMATIVVDALNFQPLLTKYRTCSASASLAPGSQVPDGTSMVWSSEDVKTFCKLAENLPYQKEAVQAAVQRLGGGLSLHHIGMKPKSSSPSVSSRDSKIANVDLLKALLGMKVPSVAHVQELFGRERTVSSSSSVAQNHLSNVTFKSKKDLGHFTQKPINHGGDSASPMANPISGLYRPPSPARSRTSISEASSWPEVVPLPNMYDDTLPEVVVENPVWLLQRQRQVSEPDRRQPHRSLSTQLRDQSAKAADLHKMFAPVPKLGSAQPFQPYIPHTETTVAAKTLNE